jgi:1-pyrroline-5-carboxylate dehydrogenase
LYGARRRYARLSHDALEHGRYAEKYAAGNFYINDKTTGAMVGQQPFGGSRASGANDKVGSVFNLIRWVNPRSIKDNYSPATDVVFPHMG